MYPKLGKQVSQRSSARGSGRDGPQINKNTHSGVFQNHQECPNDSAHADVARGAAEALFRQLWQELKIIASC